MKVAVDSAVRTKPIIARLKRALSRLILKVYSDKIESYDYTVNCCTLGNASVSETTSEMARPL